jgi:hypothetical protein
MYRSAQLVYNLTHTHMRGLLVRPLTGMQSTLLMHWAEQGAQCQNGASLLLYTHTDTHVLLHTVVLLHTGMYTHYIFVP